MISTSRIMGTGFIKCIPITFSGRFVAAAILVMEMEEVLEARITPSRQDSSKLPNILSLSASFSVAASTTKSALAMSSMEVDPSIRFKMVFFSSSLMASFLIILSRLFSIAEKPFSTNSSLMSFMTTERPQTDATWAIPEPICPAPTTPNVFISIRLSPFNLKYLDN